jgi:NAD(P)-dependent dehydrogenase (short-subunit alcohol dehydrogenase family)
MSAGPFSYAGKRVVVTGAATGVGAALVGELRGAGAASVTAVDRKPVGDVDVFHEVDLSDRTAVEQLAAALEGQVDVLFNNAGVASTLPTAVVMGVNVLAPRLLTQALAPSMGDGGAVVGTASIAGLQWAGHLAEILELLAIDDWGEVAAYVDEREGLARDTYAFSKECAQVFTMQASTAVAQHGARINSVCPGIIETPLIPDFAATMGLPIMDWMIANGPGRRATPEEIAHVLLFLGSPASVYLNGSNVVADGGFSAALATNQVDFGTLPV